MPWRNEIQPGKTFQEFSETLVSNIARGLMNIPNSDFCKIIFIEEETPQVFDHSKISDTDVMLLDLSDLQKR